MDNTKTKWTHLGLCAGYDGIGLGLETAGFDICRSFYVEIETFAAYNLVKKIEAGLLPQGIVHTNLKTFPFRKFRGLHNLILTGGFPCQPFSCAGKQKGTEDARYLFPHFLQGIGECQPDIVLLENVEGIISAKLKGANWRDPEGTPLLLHILRELERLGYTAAARVVSASEVGAPHRRKRVFIMAYRCIEGLQGMQFNRTHNGGNSIESGTHVATSKCCEILWPSRPGEPQHEWEEPRVI